MVRGTFANIQLINKLCPKDGPKTLHVPSGQITWIYDAAAAYMKAGVSCGSALLPPTLLWLVCSLSLSAHIHVHALTQCPVIVLGGRDYGSGSSRDWAAK